jgi:two-component system, OmpR family, response regulator CpxR
MDAASAHLFESRSTVLLVEDDHDIRVGVRNLLEDRGYKVLTATNGRGALELLASVDPKPSLILLDLMLPVMDGWHFAAQVRAQHPLAAIPIAIMSAFEDPPPPAGVVAFLKKPVRDDQLLQLVETYCT